MWIPCDMAVGLGLLKAFCRCRMMEGTEVLGIYKAGKAALCVLLPRAAGMEASMRWAMLSFPSYSCLL